jgi:hypothetical protein
MAELAAAVVNAPLSVIPVDVISIPPEPIVPPLLNVVKLLPAV